MEHYLDNSATTPLCEDAILAMERVMRENWGNPSSLHSKGFDAEKEITAARSHILGAMGIKAEPFGQFPQLLFTSGGTEANNLALRGVAHSKPAYRGKKIIISDCEHSSVEASAKALESDGFRIVRIPTEGGVYDFERFCSEMDKDTILVSTMLVNNETGSIFPIAKISKAAKSVNSECVVHCDAVQGFCHIPFTQGMLGADLITVSAHKIGGPKGVGGLYVSPAIYKAKKLVPLICGGEQQSGFRPGTENTVGIVGFGAAAENAAKRNQNASTLRDYLKNALNTDAFSSVRINEAPAGQQAGHILSLTLPGIRSETMMHHLSSFGVFVSNGSACSSHQASPSRALTAFGLNAVDAGCTIRVSVGYQNTVEDCDAFLDALMAGIVKLSRIKK